MEKTTEIVVATPVEPVAVRVPAEAAVAAQLLSQYRRAEWARGAFVREAVAFGALMIAAEQVLGSFVPAVTKLDKLSKRGRNGEGRANSGLEGWLAERCPEINYVTARKYKSMAAKMAEMLGGETAEVLAALRAPHKRMISYEPSGAAADGLAEACGTVSEAVIAAREEIFAAATSRRKLEQLWLALAGVDGRGAAGRPKGRKAAPAEKTASEAAQEFWALTMDALQRRSAALQSAAAFLTAAQAEAAATVLGDLAAAVGRQRAALRGAQGKARP